MKIKSVTDVHFVWMMMLIYSSKSQLFRINPMTDAVFEETFDNYIPDSRNQMISIDDRIRSIRKEVLETDD